MHNREHRSPHTHTLCSGPLYWGPQGRLQGVMCIGPTQIYSIIAKRQTWVHIPQPLQKILKMSILYTIWNLLIHFHENLAFTCKSKNPTISLFAMKIWLTMQK